LSTGVFVKAREREERKRERETERDRERERERREIERGKQRGRVANDYRLARAGVRQVLQNDDTTCKRRDGAPLLLKEYHLEVLVSLNLCNDVLGMVVQHEQQCIKIINANLLPPTSCSCTSENRFI
jgi:hypothetical protein